MRRAATVLLVEDSPALREVVTDVLTREGYRVTTAASVERALALLAVAQFDLLLSDAFATFSCSAGLDYWRILDMLAAHAGRARLIIFTAHRKTEFPGYQQHGFTAIITKPCTIATLVATVAEALLLRDGTLR